VRQQHYISICSFTSSSGGGVKCGQLGAALARIASQLNTARWADVLWGVALAYNTAVHSATGVAPATAALRFRPASSLALRAPVGEEEAGPAADGGISAPANFANDSAATTPKLYTTMAERLAKAAAAQATAHNARVKRVALTPGMDVLVFAEQRDGNNKLASHWRGPRKIISDVPGSHVLRIVEAPPESGRAHVVVHVDHLRPFDASRVSDEDRAFYNARADTYIPERVIAHRGDSAASLEFFILWRGWDAIRATWEPLMGRTADGKASGVGHVDIVKEYIAAHGLTASASTSGSRATRRKRR
jgi:hypothetical protein